MIKSYKDSGVDKEEGYKAVELMKKNVLKTHNKSVLTNLGSFGAMYELGQYKNLLHHLKSSLNFSALLASNFLSSSYNFLASFVFSFTSL